MDKEVSRGSDPPSFYASIILEIPNGKKKTDLVDFLGKDIEIKQYTDFLEVTYLNTPRCMFWELDDVLSYLFSMCNLKQLEIAREQLDAKLWITISFYHKDSFPVLIIDSENMAIIRRLQACISIDPY